MEPSTNEDDAFDLAEAVALIDSMELPLRALLERCRLRVAIGEPA